MYNPSFFRQHAALFSGLLLLFCTATVYAATLEAYLENARGYEAQGAFSSALIELKNAVQKEPANAEARRMLGELHLKLGDGLSAQKELNKALLYGAETKVILPSLGRAYLLMGEEDKLLEEIRVSDETPADLQPELYTLRGNAYLFAEQHDEAQAEYNHALALQENYSDALLGLARLALMSGDLETARQKLDAALQAGLDSLDGRMVQAELSTREGSYEKAIEALQQLLAKVPDYLPARLLKATAHIARQQLQQATQEVDYVLKREPQHPAAYYLRGLIAFKNAQYDEVKSALQKSLSSAPAHLPSLLLVSHAYYITNEFNQAEQSLKRFLAKVPGHIPAAKLLAATYLKLKEAQQAVAILEPLREKDAGDFQLYSLLGGAYLQLGDMDRGNHYLEQAATAAPRNASVKTRLAMGRLAVGDMTQAVADLESAIKLDDGLIENDILLVLIHIRQGHFDAALKAAKKLVKRQPEAPLAYNLLGSIYLAQGNDEQAQQQFRQALTIDPHFNTAQMNLASIELRQGSVERAKKRYREIVSSDPTHLGALMALSAIASEEGESELALDWLQQARERHPHAIKPAVMEIERLLNDGDKYKALALAETLRRQYPDDPVALHVLGRAQMINQRDRAALESFSQLVKLRPKSYQALLLLASAQVASGDVAAGKNSLKKIPTGSSEYLPAQLQLVRFLIADKKYKTALDRIKKIQQQYPNPSATYALEGTIQTRLKAHKQAAAAFDIAYQKRPTRALAITLYSARNAAGQKKRFEPLLQWLEQNPDDVQAHMMLANAYMANAQPAEAIEHYKKVLKSEPDNAVANNNIAWLYHTQGDAQALRYAKRAYVLAPENPAIVDTYGWLLLSQGGVQKALPILQIAAQQAPDSADIKYHLAVSYEKAGRYREARQLLKKLLKEHKVFPDLADAKALLGQLDGKR